MAFPSKTPGRDAPPADIPNAHPPSLERRGKCGSAGRGRAGSITASPITETINPDTTESIATNATPTTDGQFYTNKILFLDPFRPAIDSGPPASRIGSNAQRKPRKIAPAGIKNELTNYRMLELSSNSISLLKPPPSNPSSFQDHPLIPSLNTIIPLCSPYRNSIIDAIVLLGTSLINS